jgi:hypothetical protein
MHHSSLGQQQEMIVEAESVCKTLVDLNILTWLATREDFTEFCQGASFKTDK